MSKITRRDFIKTVGATAGCSLVASSIPGVAPAQAQTIRIGFISSLTGAQAPLGQSMLTGAQIAIDQVNQAGGVLGKKLELVSRDDKAKPADATVAARELVGSGVNLLCGVVSSSVALAVSAILEQEKAILITCAAHSDKLTKENFTRNYFRATDNPFMRERSLARVAAERYPGVTQWSGLIPDHEYGRTTWACFEDGLLSFYPAIAKKQPTIVPPIKTQYGATDYRNSVAAAMALPSEGFMMSLYGGDAVTFCKQAAPYGFFKKAKVVMDSANEFIVAKAMRDQLPEMWSGSHWYAGAFQDVPTSQALYAEAVRRTNDKWQNGWIAEGHAAVMAYTKALQAAATTETQAMIRALESVTFDTATGPRTFRKEDHQAIKPVVMYRIRGSAKAPDGFEVLDYVKVDGAAVIDPPTPGKPLVLKSAS